MKATPPSRVHPLKVQTLARRLEAWRRARTPGQRIPERLWQAAAALARVHGLSPMAAALKLNYYDLQRRLGPDSRSRAEPVAQPQFVQLPPLAQSSYGSATDPGTVELLQPCGARLILRLPDASARQLLPLVQAILRS